MAGTPWTAVQFSARMARRTEGASKISEGKHDLPAVRDNCQKAEHQPEAVEQQGRAAQGCHLASDACGPR